MFVRWKRRLLSPAKTNRAAVAGKDAERHHALDCVLVESRRVDGKPRQRQLAYLGTIREDRVATAEAADAFWRRTEEVLHRLGLPPDAPEGARVRSAISTRVPRQDALGQPIEYE